MKRDINFQAIMFLISAICFGIASYLRKEQNEQLQKEIARLKPYEEMYKVMADSVGNIHGKCFRIGE